MSKRVSVLFYCALFAVAACDDDAPPMEPGQGQAGNTGSPDGGGATKDGGGTKPSGGSGASAGSNGGGEAGAGTGSSAGSSAGQAGAGMATAGSAGSAMGNPAGNPEGAPCTMPSDCRTGLRCAASPLRLNGVPIGVCATACTMDEDCGAGFVCYSYTEMDRDNHCVNEVDEDYGLCGVADTSVCAMDKACLYFPGEPVGVCVTICQVEGAPAPAPDAGVPTGTCASGQACIDGVLASPQNSEGVCGTQVTRGEECGVDIGVGLDRAAGDVRAPEDLQDQMAIPRCFEECSQAEPQCTAGACVLIPGEFGYCVM